MKYYILPDDFGVAITNGEYLEIHIPAWEEGLYLPKDIPVRDALIELINNTAEQNLCGDAVYDDIVPDTAPVFDGEIIPDAYFYILPPKFHIPDNWEQILPTKYNESNYVDTLTEDEIMVAELRRILNNEYNKPEAEQDEDLIAECWKEIGDITGIKTEFSKEEIAQKLEEILNSFKGNEGEKTQ